MILLTAPRVAREVSLPRRLPPPCCDCACVAACGVKRGPPAAVAARGLTPPAPTKHGSGSDVSGGVVAVEALQRMIRLERRFAAERGVRPVGVIVGEPGQHGLG